MLSIVIDKMLTIQTNHILFSHHYLNAELLIIFHHLFISCSINQIYVELPMPLFYYKCVYDLP